MSAFMKTSSLLVAVLAFAACTTPTSVSSPVPAKGKPTAPVAVKAELLERSAKVTVSFESGAEDVQISVSGVDGLVVSSPAVVLERGQFPRGGAQAFQVEFAPGPGRSQLVVSVSGTFNGAKRARVAAFGIGAGPLPDTGTVMTTDQGDTVKVMP